MFIGVVKTKNIESECAFFRSWWQLNGCLGVPLYKLYKRNNRQAEWRSGEVILNEDDVANSGVEGRLNDSTLEERASLLQSKYNSSYKPAGSR